MAKFNDKISTLINSQLPDFVVDDHPQFAQFLKTYYQFMESAMLQVTSIENTDGITLENETSLSDNLLLDGSKITSEKTQLDTGDKIIYEDSSFGKFTVGETITGITSNATATVLAEDLTNNKIYISAQDKFGLNETITGNTSGAQAIINDYRPNPVTTVQDLTNFRDPDKVISNFLTNFRDEFLKTIPETLALGLDKRNLIKNIKSMYRLKGTQAGHELFFRILFNQISETFYPRSQMLRVSDGQWNTQKVLRSIVVIGDTTDLVGRTIKGSSTGATAVVESVKKFVIGNKEVSEFVLNINSMSGTFNIGEEITGTASDTDDFFIKATITGIPGLKTITNDGNLYSTGDFLTVSGGGVGVGGLISYNLFEPYFGENTKLKVILLLGEEHMNTTHCKENASTDELYSYINEYDKYILNDDKDIDIFIEHTFLDGVSYYEPTFLMQLISNLKNYIQKNPTNLKIHWTDPDIFYENINFYNDIYLHKEFYLVGNTEEVLKYEYEFVHYKYIFPSLFEKIKKQDDLVNIILDNEKIIIQAEKSILRESYNPFIKTFFDNNMNFTDENWFSEGIFWTQRLSMDFYVFFRIIRDTSLFSNEEDNLIIKNVIYQAGDFHTQKIFLMFKQLCINDKKYAINESGTDSIDGKEETECLDFTFKTFLEKTKEPIKDPIAEFRAFFLLLLSFISSPV